MRSYCAERKSPPRCYPQIREDVKRFLQIVVQWGGLARATLTPTPTVECWTAMVTHCSREPGSWKHRQSSEAAKQIAEGARGK